MPAFKNIQGERFGRLTVLYRDKRHFGRGDHTYWVCRCDCGKITRVRPDALKSGAVVSCGCYHAEISSEIGKYVNLKHGMSKSRLFRIWSDMKSKCAETQKEVPKGARIIRRISYPSGKEYFEYREKEYILQCVVSSCCGRAVKRFNTPAEAISVWNTRAPILSEREMEMLNV
nr:MAG TPA: restriction alleviation protein [Caudoviricetes sp.]